MTVLLVCLVLGFLVLEWLMRGAVNFIVDPVTKLPHAAPCDLYKCARLASAMGVVRFVATLLKVVVALALALGMFKVFGDLAKLTLPDNLLGLTLLLSYCALAAAAPVLADDMKSAVKTLFAYRLPSTPTAPSMTAPGASISAAPQVISSDPGTPSAPAVVPGIADAPPPAPGASDAPRAVNSAPPPAPPASP